MLWERKTIKRAAKPDNDRKEGKKKEREKERKKDRNKNKKTHKKKLSSLQILAYAHASKTKMKLNQVKKNWLLGNVFLRFQNSVFQRLPSSF